MPPKKIDKKAVRPRRIVVLKIDSAKLAKWAPATTAKDAATVSPSNTNSITESSANSARNSSPLAASATPQAGSPVGSAVGSEAQSVVATGAAGVSGAKPGPKRGRQPGAPPGKPGRKKQKLDNGAVPTLAIPGTSGPHKLGPKANQGAINAQLRALDRTGKPCKKWSKAGFQLRSFTGFQWSVPTWATPAVEKKLDVQPALSNPVANSASTTTPTTPLPSALNSMGGTILDITMTNA
ncbi:INO80 complex subunit Ies4-domain-containing protein [Terfezia claveryi]|nr:INO80 complex subunit Ies4-domain-containing protein [Terfezia claveryi]